MDSFVQTIAGTLIAAAVAYGSACAIKEAPAYQKLLPFLIAGLALLFIIGMVWDSALIKASSSVETIRDQGNMDAALAAIDSWRLWRYTPIAIGICAIYLIVLRFIPNLARKIKGN